MPHMTRDSAWRQWKGATRDLNRAEQRKREARDTYLIVLLHEFEQRRAEADVAGQDIQSDDAMATLGLPCVDCLEPYGLLSGHEVVRQVEGTFRLFAKCGRAAKEPQ
jgi:hypothetical protein